MSDLSKYDNIWIGMLASCIVMLVLYFLFAFILMPVLESSGKAYTLHPPRMQLYMLFLMLIVFRVAMVNLKLYNFGKGMLLALFIASLLYFYFMFHKKLSF